MRLLVFTCLFMLFSSSAAYAQTSTPVLDKSPMDVSYYPANYPLLKIQDKITEPLVARVIYSRPQKNGRAIFGDLIEYGKVWRLGANEATEIEFFQNVKIGSVKIKKGRYTLYAIPDTGKWTIIINTETDTWGSFRYDMQKDIARIEVPAEKQPVIEEVFSMYFNKTTEGFALIISWDDIKTNLPVSL